MTSSRRSFFSGIAAAALGAAASLYAPNTLKAVSLASGEPRRKLRMVATMETKDQLLEAHGVPTDPKDMVAELTRLSNEIHRQCRESQARGEPMFIGDPNDDIPTLDIRIGVDA